MNGALRLLLALPAWYFSSILWPFAAGPLSAIPAFGTLCLVLGLLLGLAKRDLRLGFFIIPVALSEVLVAVAGASIGRLPDAASQLPLLLFIAIQVVVAGYLIYRVEESRKAAFALAVFSVTYALFAAFVAGMAFSDVWL